MCTHLAQYDRAIECHQKALNTKLALLGSGSLDVAISYAWLGAAHVLNGAHETAVQYHEKALAIRKAESDLAGVAVSHMHLAKYVCHGCCKCHWYYLPF
jgi:hypothetical protein